jgi:hypothetical protein
MSSTARASADAYSERLLRRRASDEPAAENDDSTPESEA